MLSCERCGTSFSETRGGRLASCPRCRVRDRVNVPLTGRRVEGTVDETAGHDAPERDSPELGEPAVVGVPVMLPELSVAVTLNTRAGTQHPI